MSEERNFVNSIEELESVALEYKRNIIKIVNSKQWSSNNRLREHDVVELLLEVTAYAWSLGQIEKACTLLRIKRENEKCKTT